MKRIVLLTACSVAAVIVSFLGGDADAATRCAPGVNYCQSPIEKPTKILPYKPRKCPPLMYCISPIETPTKILPWPPK